MYRDPTRHQGLRLNFHGVGIDCRVARQLLLCAANCVFAESTRANSLVANPVSALYQAAGSIRYGLRQGGRFIPAHQMVEGSVKEIPDQIVQLLNRVEFDGHQLVRCHEISGI